MLLETQLLLSVLGVVRWRRERGEEGVGGARRNRRVIGGKQPVLLHYSELAELLLASHTLQDSLLSLLGSASVSPPRFERGSSFAHETGGV